MVIMDVTLTTHDNEETCISAEFWCLAEDQFDTQILSEELCLIPTSTRKKGELTQGKIPAPDTSWEISTSYEASLDINNQLLPLLRMLDGKQKILKDLKQEHNLIYGIEFFIYAYERQIPRMKLTQETIQFMSEIGGVAMINIIIYPDDLPPNLELKAPQGTSIRVAFLVKGADTQPNLNPQLLQVSPHSSWIQGEQTSDGAVWYLETIEEETDDTVEILLAMINTLKEEKESLISQKEEQNLSYEIVVYAHVRNRQEPAITAKESVISFLHEIGATLEFVLFYAAEENRYEDDGLI